MKIIVTGGAGFVGSHLCDRLIEDGHSVVCIDNLLTGSEKNIESLKQNPNFQFINHDVSQSLPEIQNFFQDDKGVDQVYHLASPASPNKKSPKSYLAHPFETMAVNSIGTWNLAGFAASKGAKFLFASTSEIYGDPLEHPQKESYRGNVSTIGPRAVYDEAKRFGETIVSAFVRSKNLDGRIVRIFNTYGPRMDPADGRVVIEFILAAQQGNPLPVFGDGNQTRSFCYVDDLINGLVAAMNTDGTKGEVFNLGNPTEYRILDLAQKIKEITGSQSEIEFHPLPEDDPLRRRPDIIKAQQNLGWVPKVSLGEGLVKLIDSLKKALEKPPIKVQV